ncbi:MAG: flagellar biosynthetic protein FliO [Spirochaetes bacterium]|nr:flagellar biosynthetic protein FliO [Spirochaetota bacterium]
MLAVLTVLPAFAQVKSNGTGQTGQAADAAGKTVNESELLIPDDAAGAGGTAAGGAAGGGATIAPAVSTWDFVRMLLILAAVVVAIYLLVALLRRGSGKRVRENDLIRVLGSHTLAGTRALHLVEVGTALYLIGSSDGGVELIAEVTDKESVDGLRLRAAEEAPGARRTFAAVLAEIFRPARRPTTMGESVGFLRRQRDRLKKL